MGMTWEDEDVLELIRTGVTLFLLKELTKFQLNDVIRSIPVACWNSCSSTDEHVGLVNYLRSLASCHSQTLRGITYFQLYTNYCWIMNSNVYETDGEVNYLGVKSKEDWFHFLGISITVQVKVNNIWKLTLAERYC